MSDFMINRAVFGVGSNVCESTPSGISPSTWTTLPATLRAMSVIGETVVTTSNPAVALDPLPFEQPASRSIRPARTRDPFFMASG